MKRLPIVFLSLLLLSCVKAGVKQDPEQPKAPEPMSVLLIGWDGVQRNHLNECLERKELPHLQTLMDEGGLVEIDISGKTDTKAGWAEILTGYGPEINRVTSNAKYAPIPEGYTIFERLEEHYGAESIVTVMIGGKKNNIGGRGPHVKKPKRKKKNNRRKERPGQRMEGEPFYKTRENMDLYEVGLGAAENVGKLGLELLEEHKDTRFFMFIHFQDPDHAGHKHGENSEEYNDAIILCDTWLKKIRSKLKELGLGERTMIYVTADHGFDEGLKSHKDAPYVWLASNDKAVKRDGNRADITPTILTRLGLELDFDPPLTGSSLIE